MVGLRVTAITAVIVAALLAVFAQSAVAPSEPEAHSARPNFVVLMTDDQTVEDLQVMPRTRRLLGGQGIRFANTYVSYPVCCPSRATYLSGQYAHNHHVMGLYPPTGGYARFDRDNSLPVWLHHAGYVTAHIGKYLNGYGSQAAGRRAARLERVVRRVDKSTYQMWGYTLNENGELHTYGWPFEEDPRLYQTDVLPAGGGLHRAPRAGARALLPVRGLRGAAPRGAVCARPDGAPRAARAEGRGDARVRPGPGVARLRGGEPRRQARLPPAPCPLDAADIAAIAARRRDRQESLLAVDDAVAAIVAALRRKHELGNTYILFTSDNGYMQGEHDVPSGKMLPYEPSTAVPLLLRGPGIPAGAVSRELVANVDLAPTILDAARARAGKLLDGRSLLPFARNPRKRTRRPILHETGGRRYILARDEDLGPADDLRRVMSYRAVRTRRWLWVEYRDGARELYDRRADPARAALAARRPVLPPREGGAAPAPATARRLSRRGVPAPGAADQPNWRPNSSPRSTASSVTSAPIRASRQVTISFSRSAM